jgi:serine phosphatase RsbU (regulator of sigma subunit)
MQRSLSTIGRLATALAGAMTSVDVAIALAEEGAAAAGATFANLAVCDADRTWVVHGVALDPDVAERWSELGPGAPNPLSDAIAGRTRVLLRSIDEIASSYPALREDTVDAGLGATASLPLVAPDGGAIGAVGFGWPDGQQFDDDQLALLDLIAEIASAALDRAVAGASDADLRGRRDLERTQLLQEIVLPSTLPEVKRLDLAAVYLPARDAPMGGDWYDVFTVDGTTSFVVGDVAGHGIEAAAVMVELRNAARAYAEEHPAPDVVVSKLNRMLCSLEPQAMATVIVAMWDPELEVFFRASAGHPPILRCRPGEFSFLESSNVEPPLGVDPTWSYTSESKKLRPGTTLVFYTDGLVERRAAALEEGMRDLRDFTASLSDLSPRSVCDAALDWRLRYGRTEDDICILAARLSS